MRCFFWWSHNWTKWTRDPNYEIIRYYPYGQSGKVGYSQNRECKKCGRAQTRKVYTV